MDYKKKYLKYKKKYLNAKNEMLNKTKRGGVRGGNLGGSKGWTYAMKVAAADGEAKIVPDLLISVSGGGIENEEINVRRSATIISSLNSYFSEAWSDRFPDEKFYGIKTVFYGKERVSKFTRFTKFVEKERAAARVAGEEERAAARVAGEEESLGDSFTVEFVTAQEEKEWENAHVLRYNKYYTDAYRENLQLEITKEEKNTLKQYVKDVVFERAEAERFSHTLTMLVKLIDKLTNSYEYRLFRAIVDLSPSPDKIMLNEEEVHKLEGLTWHAFLHYDKWKDYKMRNKDGEEAWYKWSLGEELDGDPVPSKSDSDGWRSEWGVYKRKGEPATYPLKKH